MVRGTIPNPGVGVSDQEITCHGCRGKGWVEVLDGTIELSSFEEPKAIDINISIEAGKISEGSIRKFANLLLESLPKIPER